MSLSRTAVLAAAGSASLLVLGIAAAGINAAHHDVTVSADGIEREVSGFYPTVADALLAGGIEVGEHDTTSHDPAEALRDGDIIEVVRAHPVSFHRDGRVETLMIPATSLDEAYAFATAPDSPDSAMKRTDAITVSRSAARSGLPLSEGPRSVEVELDGEKSTVRVEGGETVTQILARVDASPAPLDSLFLIPNGDVLSIRLVTETRGLATETEEIPFGTEYQDDPELPQGEEEVRQEGVPGVRTLQHYRQIVGGEPRISALVADSVTTEPVIRIVARGTKAPEPVSTPSGGTGTDVSSVQIVDGDVWAALARCESGGDPTTNTGNGYYGMYQFMLSTWQSVGGVGLPSEASAAEQTARAQILQQRSGWGQWPACSAALGLR